MPDPVADPPTEETRHFLPSTRSLPDLERAARACRGCRLYAKATQTVFGEGPASAWVMLVGEQPGDLEDRAGRPFVGPAGRELDRALAEAGIPRSPRRTSPTPSNTSTSNRAARPVFTSDPSPGTCVPAAPGSRRSSTHCGPVHSCCWARSLPKRSSVPAFGYHGSAENCWKALSRPLPWPPGIHPTSFERRTQTFAIDSARSSSPTSSSSGAAPLGSKPADGLRARGGRGFPAQRTVGQPSRMSMRSTPSSSILPHTSPPRRMVGGSVESSSHQ